MKMPHKQTSTVDHKRCGDVVRQARKRKSLSLRKLSTKVGVSLSYLSALELGRRRWTQELFESVLHAIDASVPDD